MPVDNPEGSPPAEPGIEERYAGIVKEGMNYITKFDGKPGRAGDKLVIRYKG